jgi:hypothetical protein
VEERVEALAKAALHTVLQRTVTAARKDDLREVGNQQVTAEAARVAYAVVSDALPRGVVDGMDAAYVSLRARLQQQLNQADKDRLIILTGIDGLRKVAARLGFDGTIPQWKKAVEMVATNLHDGQELRHWEPVGHFIGHEARDTLDRLIRGAGWEAEVSAAGSIPLKDAAGDLEALLFIVGDHMALCRLGSADQPSSTLDHRRICPCCNSTPTEIHQWAHRWGSTSLHIRRDMRRGEQFPSIPVIRRIPDMLHGVSNAVKRLGPLCQQFLHEQHRWRKPKKEQDDLVEDLKDIRFIKAEHWKNWYWPELDHLARTDDDEGVRDQAKAWMTLWEHTTRLCQELLRREPCNQGHVEESSGLCWKACRELGLQGTPWLHILYGHAWQYTRAWGYISWCAILRLTSATGAGTGGWKRGTAC